MSFETIATISAITETIVLLGIVLTLLNAFSEGKLAALFGFARRPAAVDATTYEAPAEPVQQELPLRRAA